MRYHLHCRAAAVAILGVYLSSSAFAQTPQQPQQELSKALSALDAWLGPGANGNGWRAYLHTPALKAELAKGAQADPAEIEQALDRFRQPQPGLELPRFVRVRKALDAWLQHGPMPSQTELPKVVLDAREKFAPVANAGDVAKTKANLVAALDRLEESFSGKNRQRWKEYLEWNDVQEQLDVEVKSDPDVMRELKTKLEANEKYFNRKPFLDAWTKLRAFIDASEEADTKGLQKKYESMLTDLAEGLEKSAAEPSPLRAAAIGDDLAWLRRMRQAHPAIRAIKRYYDKPNLYAEASAEIVRAGIKRDVDQPGPVRDEIMGTSIFGSSYTKGTIDARLVPNPSQAILETFLKGNTTSHTVGYHGPAIICAEGLTSIYGAERMYFDATGFKSVPVSAAAVTHSTITGIGTSRGGLIGRMVLRKAPQRAAEGKPQAEYVGARHAEVKIRDRLHREVGENLAKANANYQEAFRGRLERRDAFPEQLDIQTTADRLLVTALQADSDQIAAPAAPPDADASGLVLRLHQTAINNLASTFQAGGRITKDDYEKSQSTGKKWFPKELQKGVKPPKLSEGRSWGMTFADPPVTITLEDGVVRIVVHLDRYDEAQLGGDVHMPMDVNVRYKPTMHENAMQLVRQGEVVVKSPGKGGIQPMRQVALRRRFAAFFLEKLTWDPLVLPGQWGKNVGTLNLADFRSSGGWLVIGWNQANDKSADVKPADLEQPVAAAE
jgi:hypothetical protein